MDASYRNWKDKELEALFSDYIALVNRAMAENRDKFWYRLAKRMNRMLWGGANFRTVVYDGEPGNVLGTFTIHFDPDSRTLSVLPPGDHEVAFTWRAPLTYLWDVVRERPEWFLAYPTMLDWVWLKERISDEAASRVDGRSLTAGLVIGAVAALALARLSRGMR